jgi:hypothetical protein
MQLTFKPGKASEISILYGKGISDSKLRLAELCKTNQIQCEMSSNLPPNTIKFYIDPVRTRKQPQKKNTPYKTDLKCLNSTQDFFPMLSLNQTLNQYQAKLLETPSEKLTLKLVLVYIQEDKIGDYFKEM